MSETLAPLYLLVGEDGLKRETARRRLISRFKDMGDADFNIDMFDGENASVADVLASCIVLPFVSEQRLVVVDSVEKMGKEALGQLALYCDDPSETTVLCLIAEKLAKNTVLYKRIAGSYPKSIVDCAPKGRKELPQLVSNMARAHGVTMEPAAAVALIALVGDSTVRLDSELTKMAASVGAGGLISREVVARMVGRTAELKPWDLTDAFSERDITQVEHVLARLDSQSPFGLLALCETRVRDLLRAKALEDRGRGNELAAALGRPDWQVRNLRSWARRWTCGELQAALKDAERAERDMRSGADQKSRFELWLLSSCR